MNKFFIICPLNLEFALEIELLDKFQFYFNQKPQYTILEGGIELTCTLEQGLQLNYLLKSANRILLRIKEQKCRDFPKLYKIISKINWKQYTKRVEINWSITTKTSRLINTSKMIDTCNEAKDKYFNANRLSQKILQDKESFQVQTVFIRVENDNLTLSIDTSGEALHIRGGEKFRGLASIRSNIATCLLINFLKDKSDFNLLDPMCGSGTFIKEAKNFHIPNYKRKYAFEDLHQFEPLALSKPLWKPKSIRGHDIDGAIVAKLNDKLYKQADVFKSNEEIENHIIINPPYGKRVKLSMPREKYYHELITCLKTNQRGQLISIILPLDIKLKSYKSKIKIFNSGIWLYNYIIE